MSNSSMRSSASGLYIEHLQGRERRTVPEAEALQEWGAQLPKDQPVIVYCVYGHEVGRSTAMRLRAAGVEARFLRGGIDGWKSAGRPLARK